MSCLIPNTPGAYTKLRLPLTAWATSFGFVRWPRGHRRMFSFGIEKHVYTRGYLFHDGH